MSLTSKQIEELRSYAADRKGELAKLINDAADTIELLSAKLHASQMERSSQYYHGGWIPCEERLPEVEKVHSWEASVPVLVCFEDETMNVAMYEVDDDERQYWVDAEGIEFKEVVAWRPLPELYQKEDT